MEQVSALQFFRPSSTSLQASDRQRLVAQSNTARRLLEVGLRCGGTFCELIGRKSRLEEQPLRPEAQRTETLSSVVLAPVACRTRSSELLQRVGMRKTCG
jgi:hypothetical protein